MQQIRAGLAGALREVGTGRRLAAIAALLLALAVQVFLASRWSREKHALSSLNCGNYLAYQSRDDGGIPTCKDAFAAFRQAQENFTGYMAASSDHFEERLVANSSRPTVLCIGPCHELCVARAALLCWQRFLPRVVVVDPDPAVHRSVHLWLAANAIQQDSVRTIHASVCSDVVTGSEELSRGCLAPDTLLREAQLEPGDVHVLWAADSAGGQSASEVVGALLSLQGLAPLFVMSSGSTSGAGYEPVLGLPGQISLVTPALHGRASLPRREQRAQRRARLRELQGLVGAWVEYAAVALCCLAAAVFVGHRVIAWAVRAQGVVPSLERASAAVLRTAASATGFSVVTSFVGMALRLLTRWRLHRELMKHERHEVNTKALALCGAQVFLVALVRAGYRLWRKGKWELVHIAKRLLKYLALLALALIVINKVKPVVRKLRVPVAALTAELLKRPKELSCGDYAVPEPELSEECAEFMQSRLEGSRPAFEEYLAGLTGAFKNRPPGSRPTLIYVGAGSWLCELRASYPCLAPYKPRVVLVEPNPRALPGLQHRLTQMGLSWPQVSIVRVAVIPSTDASEAFERIIEGEGNESELLIKNIQNAGFQEFFRGFQGSSFVFSSFETDQSAMEPNGNFLQRIPPWVEEDGLWIRAKVWGGSCGQAPTRIEFRLGARSIKHLADGQTFGWRPIFNVRVLDGKVQELPNAMWTGKDEKTSGWTLAHISDKKKVTVFGGSCSDPGLDNCLGKPLVSGVSNNNERISLSWRMAGGVSEVKKLCTRRPLVGGGSKQVIPNTAITASSVHANCSVAGSRLDATGPQASWCPSPKDTRIFVKWDLGSVQDVSILQLRGRSHTQGEGQWVKTFRLYWSLDDASWVSLPGTEKYTGNTDKNSIVEVRLSPPITARYIVLAPLKWHKWPSLRAEFLACDNLQSRFYAFRRGTTRDWAQLPLNFPEVSAMTYKSLWSSHISNFGNARRNPGYTMAEWGKLAETHVEELRARQVSPSELLQELQVAPSSVDVLSISTRGRGLEVAADFLALQGLRPKVLRADPDAENFEKNAYDVALSALQQALQSGGYNYSIRGEELVARKVEPAPSPNGVAPAPLPPGPDAQVEWRPVVRRLARKTILWLVVLAIGVPLLVVAWRFVASSIQEGQLQAFVSDWKANLGFCSVLKWTWWLLVPSFVGNYVLKGDLGLQVLNDVHEFERRVGGREVVRNPPAWMSESDCAAPSPACTLASWKGYSEMSRFLREHGGDKNLSSGTWRWDPETNAWVVPDRVHKSTLLRSETFFVGPRLRISVTSPAGHTGWCADVVGKNASELPRSKPQGFLGVAIRDDETDLYLLSKSRRRETMSAPFTSTKQVLTFAEEELAPFLGKRVTLDVLDFAVGMATRIHIGEVSFEGSCAHKCRRYAERRATRSVTSLENISRSLAGHFAVKAREGRRPVMVHLGSGTSLCELAEMLPCLSKWSPKHVFIEPNINLLPFLRRRLVELDVPPSSVTILPAAVVPQKSAEICAARRALVEPLDDSAITAEGSRSEGLPNASRLNGTGWIALRNTGGRPWIKWDLGREEEIFQIKLLGRDPGSGYAQWVTSFTLSFSHDNLNWIRPWKGSLEGNIDRVNAREHVFSPPIKARYVRLRALSWAQWPSLRAEFYACDGEPAKEEKAPSAWNFSNAALWTFNPAVSLRWPLLPSSLNEFSSLDLRILAAGHREAFTDPDINPGYGQAEWSHMGEHVVPVVVRTTSLANVLVDVHVDPKDVDVISIDARGHNLEILRDLLELPGFRPVYLRFEWDVATNIHDAANDTASGEYLTEKLEPMVEALADMGYRLDTLGPEIVAVKQEVLDFQPLPPAPWVGYGLPTPVDLGIAKFQDHFKPRRWAVPSCISTGPAIVARVNDMHDLRCCSRKGDSCSAPPEALDGPMTFDQAVDVCRVHKLRVCTRQELEQDLCREFCAGGYVWSQSRAFVLGDEVATHRIGRGWTPAKVVGIKREKSGQHTYMLEWVDKAQQDQMKNWLKLEPITRRSGRSFVLVFILVASILSLHFRLAKFAWDSERLGHWVDEKLSRFRLSRRMRIIILGLAVGHDLSGAWSSQLERVVALFSLCPPSYRGETMVVAFWAMLAFRSLSFVQGGPWLGLKHPEPPYLHPSAPLAWPDATHTSCIALSRAAGKHFFEATKQQPTTIKALEEIARSSGSNYPHIHGRQLMAIQVCRKSWASFQYNDLFDPDSVMSNLGRVFRDKARYGERPNIIHIGPKDTVCDMRITYPCLQRFRPRMYFLEPDARVLPSLAHALRDFGALNETAKGSNGDTHIVHGALCPEDRKEATFYAFSDRLLEDYDLLSTTFEELSSINRTILESLHRENFNRTDKNPGYSQEVWDNMTTYIEETPTRCWTPVSFLTSTRVWAEAIDILTIDARGYNIQLLQQFLQMDKFWPSYIRFEWDAAANGASAHANDPEEYVKNVLAPLLSALEMRGYRVGTLNHEMVAVHASIGGREKLADLGEADGAKRTGSVDS